MRSKVNIGKWVLRNLFLGFVLEEQRIRRKRDIQGSESSQPSHTSTHRGVGRTSLDLNGDFSSSTGLISPLEISRSSSLLPICTAVVTSANALPAILPALPSVAKPSPLLTPMIPLKPAKPTNNTPQSPSSDKPLMPRPIRTHGLDLPPPSASREPDYFSARARRPSTASAALSDGDFPGWGGPGSPPRHVGDFSGPITPITPGGGFMGRLKSLGKGPGRRTVNDTVPSSPVTSNVADTLTVPEVSAIRIMALIGWLTSCRVTSLAVQGHPLKSCWQLPFLRPRQVKLQLSHFHPT
jgi:WD repeat-containing protein 48